ncbi:MAG: tRNA uridine-5-carboxymethylaminomethyl(34) synthesis GTPase MnmE [Eubacteriales bacterium]
MFDTIVALATRAGEGAVHIIRLSGADALKIINCSFKPVNLERWNSNENFTIHLGWFYDGDTLIDQVLVSKMKSPFSYTGEDVLEINCHGGMLPVRRILEICMRLGARHADKGEFTKRAFLNGKMDLIQAEAIIDLINSRTEFSANLAVTQLGGKLSEKINELRSELLDILAYVEANIDFPEDEIEDIAFNELYSKIEHAKCISIEIFKGSKTGKILRDGFSTVIAGRTNVGKSSLLNALLREERAIVTDIPGTTRDEIHEFVNLGQVLLHLIDTAGLRESLDPVEKIGIERTWKALNIADVILLLLDVKSVKDGVLSKDEEIILNEYGNKTIVLVNKVDLEKDFSVDIFKFSNDVCVIPFSVKEYVGFNLLEDEIIRRVFDGQTVQPSDALLSNIRQIEAMEKAINALEKAQEAVYQNVPIDLVSIDIRIALEEVSAITGQSVQDDLLENIFSRFCVGK